MVIYLNIFNFENYKEYVFTLFLLNILVYLILLFSIFSLFFVLDIKFVKTLNQLKFVGGIQSFSILIILSLMSFAGIPPLFGFASKFFIFISLFSKSNFYFIFLFSFLNIFLMYFYIQNFRFVVTKQINSLIFQKINFLRQSITINSIVFFNFINVFGVVFLEEFLILFNFLGSNIYF